MRQKIVNIIHVMFDTKIENNYDKYNDKLKKVSKELRITVIEVYSAT